MFKDRILIPSSLRREALEVLHAAHQGVSGMKARASQSVFWPGISADISNRRSQCQTCNSIAPSQPRLPMAIPPLPAYPFEQVVADYFYLHGHQYLVYADRYTGWITIAQTPSTGNDADSLVKDLRTAFGLYGAPAELATDGGPPFASRSVQQFLTRWGVQWRCSSAYYPQSNGRAELAVKTGKRLLRDHITPSGKLDTDAMARALLQYRNTPLQGINESPAQLLYGRQLRDHLPSTSEKLEIREEWRQLAQDREKALRRRHVQSGEQYNEHTRNLPPLQIGDIVYVQNQVGANPRRWEKTGRIVEIHEHNQYTVRMDGSGRTTLRNRRFLRKCIPFLKDDPDIPIDFTDQPPAIPHDAPQNDPHDVCPSESNHEPYMHYSEPHDTSPPLAGQHANDDTKADAQPIALNETLSEETYNFQKDKPEKQKHSSPNTQPPVLRRSNRANFGKAPARFTPQMRGKSHDACQQSLKRLFDGEGHV